MNTALLLIALGFGFKIFVEASSYQKKSLKRFGRLIGIVIMIVSFVGTLCVLSCVMQYRKQCPEGIFGKAKLWCPLSGGAKAPQPEVTQ